MSLLSFGNYVFLEFISGSPDGTAARDSLHRRFGASEANARIRDLRAAGLIEPAEYAPPDEGEVFRAFHPTAYKLTLRGSDALAEYQRAQDKVAQDIAKQDAKEESVLLEKRKDRKIATRRFYLGLVIGWLLGAFTPGDAWRFLSEQIPKLWEFIQSILPF